MSKSDSPEAKELRLVGNVELRLAMITTDSAMEKALNTYLAPLLLKLASEYVSVRNKVSGSSPSIRKMFFSFKNCSERDAGLCPTGPDWIMRF